jgi:drug/metabolite transporter (DMT)-like permease
VLWCAGAYDFRMTNDSSSAGSLAAGFTVVTWAAAFPAIRVGLDGFSPLALGLARLLFGALGLGLAALVVRPALPPRRLWLTVAMAGLLGQALYQALLMVGERRVPAGTASILIATAPVFSVLAASRLLGESAAGRWPGMLIAFAGAGLVGVSLGVGGGAFALAVMAAAVCQGLYHVVIKPLSEAVGAFGATFWSLLVGAVLMLPAAPSLASAVPRAPVSSAAAAAFLGLVPSALGYLAWSLALARAPIAHTTAALYLVPAVASLMAWAWIGERPAPLALAGGALAVIGVVLIRRAPRRSLRLRCSTSAG